MPHSLVLTVIGSDKPGLVEALSQTIADHDGNWLESRMAHLAGRFAGILRVSAPAETIEDLTRALEALGKRGLRVAVERSDTDDDVPSDRLVRLELVGNDRPGIIREVSQALARRKVNVEELATECTSAPMAGGRLFRATAEIRMPEGLTLDDLASELEEIAHDLIVDIHLDRLD